MCFVKYKNWLIFGFKTLTWIWHEYEITVEFFYSHIIVAIWVFINNYIWNYVAIIGVHLYFIIKPQMTTLNTESSVHKDGDGSQLTA